MPAIQRETENMILRKRTHVLAATLFKPTGHHESKRVGGGFSTSIEM